MKQGHHCHKQCKKRNIQTIAGDQLIWSPRRQSIGQYRIYLQENEADEQNGHGIGEDLN